MKRRNVSRWVAAIMAIATAAVVSASIGSGAAVSAASVSSSGAKAKAAPIVIGAAIAETGALSPYDVPPLEYVREAVHDLNAKGGVLGHQLVLKVADTKSDLPTIGSTAQGLLDAGAKLIITTCDFNYGGPAALAAGKKGVLGLSPCAESPSFGKQRLGPLAFTFGLATPTQSAAMAEYSYKKLKTRKAFLLVDPSIVYNQDICNYFKQSWSQYPGTKIAGQDTFNPSDTSLSEQINRIQSSGADEVILCSIIPQAASATKQIRAAGVNVPIFAPGALDGTYWLKSVPNLSNFYNVAYESIYGDDPNPLVNRLVKRGHAAGSFALAGYSVVQGWALAVKRAGTTDGKAVAAQLEKFRNVPLPSGVTTFTPGLHISLHRQVAIISTMNGKKRFNGYITPTKVPQPKF